MSARKLINYRWTDWVEHDHKGCPFPDGVYVECDFESEHGDFELGWGMTGADGGASWDHANWQTPDAYGHMTRRIRAYRVRYVDCPALLDRDAAYPFAFGGLVPVVIVLPKKAGPDRVFAGDRQALDEVKRTYPCWVDRFGGVTVIFGSGKQMFLQTDHYEVLAAFDPSTGLVVRFPKVEGGVFV